MPSAALQTHRCTWLPGALLATTCALLGCAQITGQPGARGVAAAAIAPAPAAPAADQRERMRTIAKVHCGTCHQAALPTAKPAALAVHNLDAPEWPVTLSAAQLEGGFTRRLNGRLGEEEKQLLREFVAAEVARRRP